MKNLQKGFVTWGVVAIVAVVAIAAGAFLTIQRNENGQKESGWKLYAVNEYQFKYPSSWKPVVISGQASAGKEIVDFIDAQEKKVATLECSIPEVGYEAWDLSSKDRRLDVGDIKHGATFRLGGPKKEAGVGPIFIVYMYRNTFPDTWGNNADDHAHSCRLIHFADVGDNGEIIGQIFEEIYESVSILPTASNSQSNSVIASKTSSDLDLVYPNGAETFNSDQTILISYSVSPALKQKISYTDKTELYLLDSKNTLVGYIGKFDPNLNQFAWNPSQLIHNAGLDTRTEKTLAGQYRVLMLVRPAPVRTCTECDSPVDTLDNPNTTFVNGKLTNSYLGSDFKVAQPIASDASGNSFTVTNKVVK